MSENERCDKVFELFRANDRHASTKKTPQWRNRTSSR